MYEKARDTAVGAAAAAGEGAQNRKDRVMGPSTGTGTGYSSGTGTGTGTGYSSGTHTGSGTGTGYSSGTGTGTGTGTGYSSGTGTGYGTGHTVRPCRSCGCQSTVLGVGSAQYKPGHELACTVAESLACAIA